MESRVPGAPLQQSKALLSPLSSLDSWGVLLGLGCGREWLGFWRNPRKTHHHHHQKRPFQSASPKGQPSQDVPDPLPHLVLLQRLLLGRDRRDGVPLPVPRLSPAAQLPRAELRRTFWQRLHQSAVSLQTFPDGRVIPAGSLSLSRCKWKRQFSTNRDRAIPCLSLCFQPGGEGWGVVY